MRSFSLLVALAILITPALDACKKKPDGASSGEVAVVSATAAASDDNPKHYTTAEYMKAPAKPSGAPTVTPIHKDGAPLAAVGKLAPRPELAAEKAAAAEK